jgi:hypothetical protein
VAWNDSSSKKAWQKIASSCVRAHQFAVGVSFFFLD